MDLGDRIRHHSVALGSAALGILALASVAGLVVAEARLDDIDVNGTVRPSTTTTVVDAAPADSTAAELLAEINAARTNAGVGAVDDAAPLARKAQRWAEHMATARHLSHQELDPLLELGYTAVGETILSGVPGIDAAGIRQSWMDSPTNRATLVTADFTRAGVGVARDVSGQTWVAVLLAG